MNLKFYTLIFLIAAGTISGCKSAGKLYQQGNYDEAVKTAASKLQKKPNDRDLQDILVRAYDYAVADHETRISDYLAGSSDLRWEWAYNEYLSLQRLYDAIFRAPSVFDIVHPTDYSASIREYADKAAEMHLNRGISHMNENNKQAFREAYYEFQAADRFRPGDADIKQQMDEAYSLALTRVVIQAEGSSGYQFSSFGTGTSGFSGDLVQALQRNSGNPFVRFFSSWEASNGNMAPDEVIELSFTGLRLGHIDDQKRITEVSKDVVVKEKVYNKDSVVKEYKKVKARIITTTRTVYSEGTLAYGVRAGDGRWLMTDNIVGTNRWVNVFSQYTGDERALSEEDRKLLQHDRDLMPREQDIIREITNDIYGQLLTRLRNHYSRY
jgi:tetratricopeptide (TPR) repeat protein